MHIWDGDRPPLWGQLPTTHQDLVAVGVGGPWGHSRFGGLRLHLCSVMRNVEHGDLLTVGMCGLAGRYNLCNYRILADFLEVVRKWGLPTALRPTG